MFWDFRPIEIECSWHMWLVSKQWRRKWFDQKENIFKKKHSQQQKQQQNANNRIEQASDLSTRPTDRLSDILNSTNRNGLDMSLLYKHNENLAHINFAKFIHLTFFFLYTHVVALGNELTVIFYVCWHKMQAR